jgi:zinc/manganese transport system permease protein
MSLVGDAMSHAILPGVSLAFLFFGLSVWPMTIAALGTGLVVAVLAFTLTRITSLKEDASFTLIYLISLAFGVVMVSKSGSGVDLLHILFGNILAIDSNALVLSAGVACLSVLILSQNYRGLIIDCFDEGFIKAVSQGRNKSSQIFFVLVVLSLVASFQILGTLMSLGLMILPAIAGRFWTNNIDIAIPFSIIVASVSSLAGLLMSYHLSVPTGPAVVLVTGAVCVFSIVFGRYGSVRTYMIK